MFKTDLSDLIRFFRLNFQFHVKKSLWKLERRIKEHIVLPFSVKPARLYTSRLLFPWQRMWQTCSLICTHIRPIIIPLNIRSFRLNPANHPPQKRRNNDRKWRFYWRSKYLVFSLCCYGFVQFRERAFAPRGTCPLLENNHRGHLPSD